LSENVHQNDHLDAALQYHSGTKHSYQSLRMHPHSLDWENKPLLFKIYPTLEVTRLPRDFRDTGRAALSAIADPGVPAQEEAIPDLETLAELLFFSAGVIRSKKHAEGETFFRAAACTGAGSARAATGFGVESGISMSISSIDTASRRSSLI